MNVPLIASLMKYVYREFVAAHQNVWQRHKSKLRTVQRFCTRENIKLPEKSGSFLMTRPLKQPLKQSQPHVHWLLYHQVFLSKADSHSEPVLFFLHPALY